MSHDDISISTVPDLPDRQALEAAACAAGVAGHDLAEVVFNALSDKGREKWLQYALAGAEVALTLKWTQEKVMELRLGILLGDAEPQTVLALDFTTAPGGGAASLADIVH